MLYLYIISIGICISLNIVAIWLIDKKIGDSENRLLNDGRFITNVRDIFSQELEILDDLIVYQNKKTRKDLQEVKTRLTQIRKDLNKIETSRKK